MYFCFLNHKPVLCSVYRVLCKSRSLRKKIINQAVRGLHRLFLTFQIILTIAETVVETHPPTLGWRSLGVVNATRYRAHCLIKQVWSPGCPGPLSLILNQRLSDHRNYTVESCLLSFYELKYTKSVFELKCLTTVEMNTEYWVCMLHKIHFCTYRSTSLEVFKNFKTPLPGIYLYLFFKTLILGRKENCP